MAARENEFELRLGKPPGDHAPRRLKAVRAAVRQATHQPRASGPKPRQPGIRAHFAPGSKARARPMSATSRRVVVKVRYAANAGGKAAPHLVLRDGRSIGHRLIKEGLARPWAGRHQSWCG